MDVISYILNVVLFLAFIVCLRTSYILYKKERKARIKEVKDVQARFDEIKKIPLLACMTDAQVVILGEMLARQIKEHLSQDEKEYVN